MPIYNEICVYIGPSTSELALYSTDYCHIVYYEGRLYGQDGGYEGDNLTSRIAVTPRSWRIRRRHCNVYT